MSEVSSCCTNITGQRSHSEGITSRATGMQSFSEGYNSVAYGFNSFAYGGSSQANGICMEPISWKPLSLLVDFQSRW